MALIKLNGKIRAITTKTDKKEGINLIITLTTVLNTPAKLNSVSPLVKKQNTNVLVTIEETEPELPFDDNTEGE